MLFLLKIYFLRKEGKNLSCIVLFFLALGTEMEQSGQVTQTRSHPETATTFKLYNDGGNTFKTNHQCSRKGKSTASLSEGIKKERSLSSIAK